MSKILLNLTDKDTSVLNNIQSEYLWKIIPQKFENLFVPENLLTFKINNSLNFRPDIVSFKVYNNDLFYPIILYSNNIGTIMQFRTDIIGIEIKYLAPQYLEQIINNL